MSVAGEIVRALIGLGTHLAADPRTVDAYIVGRYPHLRTEVEKMRKARARAIERTEE